MNTPGTNGVVRVGGCATPGPGGVRADGGAGAGSRVEGVGGGADAGTLETGWRLAQPARKSAKKKGPNSQMEHTCHANRMPGRSLTPITELDGHSQQDSFPGLTRLVPSQP